MFLLNLVLKDSHTRIKCYSRNKSGKKLKLACKDVSQIFNSFSYKPH